MTLPACHSRRDLAAESDVFYCAHPRMHVQDQRVTAAICTICSYWREPPPETFRPFPPPLSSATALPRGQCRHLGEQTGLRDCSTCGGNVRVKVFACAHPAHAETTIQECLACADHEEREQDRRAGGVSPLLNGEPPVRSALGAELTTDH